MKMLSRVGNRVLQLVLLIGGLGLVTNSHSGGTPIGGLATGSAAQVVKICTQQSVGSCGDPVPGPAAGSPIPGWNTFHRYFIEVPSGFTALNVELFDADAGAGPVTGNVETSGLDFSAMANGFQGTWEFTLRDPAGTLRATTNGALDTVVQSSTTQPNECAPLFGDNIWCAPWGNSIANPAAGHWEVRVAATNAGDDRSAYGLRASGVRSAATVDLNVNSDSVLTVGQNSIAASSVNLTSYPYVTGYCSARARNVEHNSEGTITITASSAPAIVNPPAALVSSQSANFLSTGDGWDSFGSGPSGDLQNAVRRGIWTSNVSTPFGINYAAAFVKPPVGQGTDIASIADDPSSDNPLAYPSTAVSDPSQTNSAYRSYLPRTDGTAPNKPSLLQRTFHVSGPNPTVIGQTTVYRVSVEFQNFTGESVSFSNSASRVVTVNVPAIADGATYVGGSALISQGTVVSQPANLGTGDVVWDPGTVLAGTAATLTYQVSVTRTAATPSPLRLTGTPTAGGGGTTAVFLDETGNSAQGRATYTYGPLCDVGVPIDVAAIVPVTLAQVSSTLSANSVAIVWQSASETGTLGFNIVDSDSTTRRALSNEMIAARGHYSVAPERYEATINSTPSEFWIEEVDFDGKRSRFGPFTVGKPYGETVVTTPIDWARVAAEQTTFRANRTQTPARVNNELVAELRIDRKGIARVSYEALAAGGVDLVNVPVKELALSRNGAQLARFVSSNDALFGAGDYLEFIATPLDSLYTKTAVYNVYRSATDVVAALTSAVQIAEIGVLTQANANVVLDSNLFYGLSAPGADPWYLRALTRTSNAAASAQFSLETIEMQGGNSAELLINFWGGLAYAEGGQDHSVQISVNGQVLATKRFDGIVEASVAVVVPDSLLNSSGPQTVELSLLPDTGFPTDRINIESVGLRYVRALKAQAGVLEFAAVQTENQISLETVFRDGLEGIAGPECQPSLDGFACINYRVSGFSGEVSAYRSRGSELTRIVTRPSGSNGASFVAAERLEDTYVFADQSALIRPVVTIKPQPANLLNSPASYLIIAHDSFVNSLAPLIAARTADGFNVKVVTVQDIYAQYAGGVVDPMAINRYLRAAVPALGTTHVLLVGGDTYDYFNYSGQNAISFVPTLYKRTSDFVSFAPSDLSFADINGDLTPDVAIGRFPVRTNIELQNLIEKTLAYGTAAHARKSLLVADRSVNGANFVADSNTIANALGVNWQADSSRVFLNDYSNDSAGIAQARSDLVSSINNGRALVSFVGHSSPNNWTFNSLLTANQVNNGLFNNSAAPSLIAQWGCYGTYFVVPQYNSLPHALLLKNSGAAALIGSSSLSDTANDVELGKLLFSRLEAGDTVGLAMTSAIRNYANVSNSTIQSLLGTTLLGDPALKLRR